MFASTSRRLGCATGCLLALLGLSSTPALAVEAYTATKATCTGQTFSQPFAAYGDTNYYTLASGGEFASPTTGWELSGGAKLVATTRPDKTTGGALDMPSGAKAVSPAICVTLAYHKARLWVRNVKGAAGVLVAVSYPGVASQNVALLQGTGTSWTLPNAFDVLPGTSGSFEEASQVRFVFKAGGSGGDFQIYDLYVDPRMR